MKDQAELTNNYPPELLHVLTKLIVNLYKCHGFLRNPGTIPYLVANEIMLTIGLLYRCIKVDTLHPKVSKGLKGPKESIIRKGGGHLACT